MDALPGDSDISRAVSFNVPEGWDYPVDESLLPFGHGVASGDPLSDRVILWTRVSVPDPRGYRVANPQGLRQIRVFWAISEDPEFTRIVQSGAVTTTRDRDWTVKVDAQGLQSATTYYYAFAALGRTSLIGRTRTAPKAGDDISDLRIVNAACSSYWSMDFHPYRFISQRDDIDLFCHAGDYIYEFVDDKGWYRARKDRFDLNDVDFRKWFNRDECARRYALYRSDPDLMRAHQCVPFAIMPDQHDFDNEVDPDTGIEFTQEEAAEVFWLWTPSRPTRPDGGGAFMDSPGPNEQVPAPTGTHALLDYRCLEYGDLCDVILLDIRRFRDAGSATALSTLLGEKQTAWLKQTLMASWSRRQVAFRVLVNQINLSQLGTTEVTPAVRTIFGPDVSGPELYTSGWGGFPEARRELYEFLRQNRIIDNVVLSGDSHGWFANDLIEDPSAPNYVPALDASGPAGQLQTVGVELVPSALGRPGGAEVIAGEIYEQTMNRKVHDDYQNFHSNFVPLGEAAVRGLESAARIANPNLRYFNWRTYGYGLSHFTRESHVFELWEVSYPADDGNERLIQQFDNRVGNPGLLARPALFRKPTSGTDPVDQSRQPPDAGTSAPIGRLRS
ncbi:MAG: alkaline phosphatase D family protein [Oleiphilaceae bacterium]|nr:alkaline phosphatase D family protein [Oleiphilaceae bacterium]